MSSLTEHACLHPPILPHKPDAPKVHPHKWQCHLSNCQTRSWIRSSLPHTILQETSFCLPSRCILIRPCPHPHCHPPAPRPGLLQQLLARTPAPAATWQFTQRPAWSCSNQVHSRHCLHPPGAPISVWSQTQGLPRAPRPRLDSYLTLVSLVHLSAASVTLGTCTSGLLHVLFPLTSTWLLPPSSGWLSVTLTVGLL